MEKVQETHLRTVAKTIAYRIGAMISIMAIAYFIFNDLAIAGGMGMMVILLGTTLYYLHDRIWLFFGWNRDNEGKDGLTRSTLKTISYRVIVMIAMALTVKLVAPDSTSTQVGGFILAQLIANVVIYFIVERIFNIINWGKVKTTANLEQKVN
jgi:uncharacterized membrane protein